MIFSATVFCLNAVFATLGGNAPNAQAPAPALPNFPMPLAPEAPACVAISSKWPEIVNRIEASFRTKRKEDFEAGKRRLVAWIDGQKTEGCPPWPTTLAVQRALLEEFAGIFAITHAADGGPSHVAGRDVVQIGEEFRKLNDEACVRGSTQLQTAWRIYRAESEAVPQQQRHQRFLTNLQTDGSVVARDGSLGNPNVTLQDFTGLAHTPVLPSIEAQMDSLQGQGPYGAKAAEVYVTGASRYARQHGANAVLFVNVAGGQVPSFAMQVEQAQTKLGVTASYVQYDGWKDGTLATPKQVADFVQGLLANGFDPTKKVLLVVNCHAGMDRSGTVNALTQLILSTQKELAAQTPVQQAIDHGFAAIPKAVWQIKSARPHGISSAGRYIFLYQAYAAYAEGLQKN